MNNYEAPLAVGVGNAHDMILGQKPVLLDYTDSAFEVDRAEPIMDIDETDD
jgi:hypothetical protein